MELPHVISLKHFSGVTRVADVLEAFGGVSPRVLDKNLFTPRMLQCECEGELLHIKRNTIPRQEIL